MSRDAKKATGDDPAGRWTGTWCPQCGPHCAVDEDGCCAACGCQATGHGAEEAVSLLRVLGGEAATAPVRKAIFELAAAAQCEGCARGWAYSGGKHTQPPTRGFGFDCRAGWLRDLIGEMGDVRAFVMPSVARASSTCVYLRDGTKVVARRAPGCGHPVRLEVHQQAVVRPAHKEEEEDRRG